MTFNASNNCFKLMGMLIASQTRDGSLGRFRIKIKIMILNKNPTVRAKCRDSLYPKISTADTRYRCDNAPQVIPIAVVNPATVAKRLAGSQTEANFNVPI